MAPFDRLPASARRAVLDDSNADASHPPPRSSEHEPDDGLLDAYSRAVSGAVARVRPSVVHIGVERPARRGRAQSGSGSGFIIPPDGYLITNSHVAAGAVAFPASLTDGRFVARHPGGDAPGSHP